MADGLVLTEVLGNKVTGGSRPPSAASSNPQVKHLSRGTPRTTKLRVGDTAVRGVRPMEQIPNHNWQQAAACKGCDPDIFFPGRGDNITARLAKETCAVCSVKTQCLDYALEHGEHFGIWGGVSEKARRKIASQRRQALAATG
ncbi:MAG: WhiB family transcriptional regulator [Acidimicrobiales bacterium]